MISDMMSMSKRQFGKAATAAFLAGLLAPHMAFADEKTVAAEIKKLYGDKPMTAGKVKLDVPKSPRTVWSCRSALRLTAR